MADNLGYNEGAGAEIRSVVKNSNHAQVIILDVGGAGAESLLTLGQALKAASLPVTLASDQGTITVSAGFDTATRYAGKLLATALTASYQNLLTPGVATRMIRVMNNTDGDVLVSLDGGSTEHTNLGPGEPLIIDYGASRLEIEDQIYVKDGAKAPANGTVHALAWGG